jgi:small subunit ribosomal protein S3Ae
VLAPKFLGEVEIAKTPASDEATLMNRVIILPLKEVSRDIAHIYTNIKLRVFEIKGKTAFTKFIGHEISREYLGTLVRRHRDALHVVYPVRSKDGVEFTVKILVVTAVPCSDAQKTALRNALKKELEQKVAATDFGKFITEALYGRLGAELSYKLKRVAPIRRIEIKKTQLKEEFDTDAVEKVDKIEAPAESPS